MPGVQSAARLRACFVVLAMLVASFCLLAGVSAPSAHAGSTVGSFEIDGNTPDSPAGEPIDWDTPAPNVTAFTEPAGKDDIFTGGSKELEPSGWVCSTGSAPPKVDIKTGAVGFRTVIADYDGDGDTEPHQFAYVRYTRAATTGDSHVDYEFNQSTLGTNLSCPDAPRRTPGDRVITIDYEQGAASAPNIRLFTWDGMTLQPADIGSRGVTWDAATNATAKNDGNFGEAIIDLTATIGNVSCGSFAKVWMKTRSSTSIGSELKDRVLPKTFDPGNCPSSSVVKGVRVHKSTEPQSAYTEKATAKPGDTLDYQLSYTNTGGGPATGVVITDKLAEGQTYVAGSCAPTPCSYDAASRTVTFSPATPIATTATFTFSVTLTGPFGAGDTHIFNTSIVKSDTEPPKSSNQTDVTVTAAPKSVPGKKQRNVTTDTPAGSTNYTASNISASPGDTLEYQLTYTNGGNATAATATITDSIPAGASFVAGSCIPACETTGTPVTSVKWTFTDVAPGVTKTVMFRVVLSGPFAPGTSTAVTNTVVTCSTGEPLPCPSTKVTTDVKTPNSNTAKSVSVNGGTFTPGPTTANPGDTLQYKLVYTNSGPGIAHNVTLTEPIPNNSTYVSCNPATATEPTCTTTGSPVTSIKWSFGDVPAGGTRTVTFTVKLDQTFPSGTTDVKNTAVSNTKEEGDKNSNTVIVKVTAKPNLKLVKSASSLTEGKAVPGEEITYTLAYSNPGDATARDTKITEDIPAGTTYVSSSPSCTPNGTPVTSVTCSLGDVKPGDTGTVTLVVRVNDDVGCQVCNTAYIKSADQNNGTPVASNQVCLTGVPAPNPAGAHANGTGEALGIVGLNLLNIGLVPDTHVSPTSSAQSGPGADGRSATAQTLSVPTVATAKLLNSSVSSTVTAAPARARQQSTGSAAEVSLLSGLITADTLRASAQATATGDASSYSAAGTTTQGLTVLGVNRDNVPPNTTITIPDSNPVLLLLGLKGVSVTVNEQVGSTSSPAPGQLSGGTYSADLTVYALHVHMNDANLGKGGSQPGDLYVGKAVAHADFPQTRLCETAPLRSVSGHAFIASVKTAPSLVEIVHGFAGIPTSGGSDSQAIANVDVTDTGGFVDADAADSSSTGTVTTLGSSATSYAQAANVCVKAPMVSGCVVGATLVRSQSNSTANGVGRSSNATGTKLLGVSLLGGTIPIPDNPPPNTTIPVPGVGTLVLNEQIPDAAETGHTGLTVRSLHLTLLDPTAGPLGAEVIVAEAHSDARFIP